MTGRRLSILALCLSASGILPFFSAAASETVVYTYDARGRLVKVERSGSVNNGAKTEIQHDKADNRKKVVITGAN